MSALPALMRSHSAGDGAPSRLMRATAASAPSNTMFSVSCTLRLRRRRWLKTCASTPGRSRCRTTSMCVAGVRLRQVDDVRHAAGLLVAADDADRLGGNRFLRLIGGRADVVRAVDAGQRRRIVVKLRRRRRRLVGEHVEADAEAFARGRPPPAPA